MVPDLLDIWNLIIRPTLIDFQGDADFYSTPRGLNGFYKLWQQGGEVPGWERFKYSSYAQSAYPTRRTGQPEGRFIRTSRAGIQSRDHGRIPGRWRILPGHRESGNRRAAGPARPARRALSGHGNGLGAYGRFTVLTLACRECNRVVAWERFNQIDYSFQRMKVIIWRALECYGITARAEQHRATEY